MLTVIEIPLSITPFQIVAVPNGAIITEVRLNPSNQPCLYVLGIQGKATYEFNVYLFEANVEAEPCNTFLGSISVNNKLYFAFTD